MALLNINFPVPETDTESLIYCTFPGGNQLPTWCKADYIRLLTILEEVEIHPDLDWHVFQGWFAFSGYSTQHRCLRALPTWDSLQLLLELKEPHYSNEGTSLVTSPWVQTNWTHDTTPSRNYWPDRGVVWSLEDRAVV